MELDLAIRIAEEIGFELTPYIDRLRVAGSIRRQRPEVGDIELVCTPKVVMRREGLFDAVPVRHLRFGEIIRKYEIVKGNPDTGKYIQFVHPVGIKVDLFTAVPTNFGFIMAIRTGSTEFSKFLAKRWVQLGYKGIEGNLTRDGKIIPVRSEKAFFDLLDLPMVPPDKRNQGGLP